MESNRDYLMRMIQLLFDSLLRINKAIDKEDESGGRQELANTYRLFKKSKDYFLNSTVSDIIDYLSSIDSSKRIIGLTGNLLFFEAELEKKYTVKKNLLIKSKELLEYYSNNSNTFSIDHFNLLNKINIKLDNMTHSSL